MGMLLEPWAARRTRWTGWDAWWSSLVSTLHGVPSGRQQVAAVSLTCVWAHLSSSPVSLLQNRTGRRQW